MSTLLQDIRYALRVLAGNPGFTAVAVGTLALGIGANTAIFTAVHHLLFRPYPFLETPGRLAAVWQVAPGGYDHNEVSPADFRDWRANLKSFDHLVTHVWWTGNVTGGERPERIQGFQVSADYFEALGLRPALGRTFVAGEDEPGRDRLVVLSWGVWQRRFGGDRSVLGTIVSINGIPRTIIGVMPDGVRYPAPAEMWAPYAPPPETWMQRQAHYLLVTGRLAPGKSVEQARAELATLTGALAAEHPETNRNWGGNVRPLVRDTARQVEPMLAVLMAAVGFVLLIVCANVANLMLARATGRGRELGIRRALGASRGRITRLIMVESMVIALAGGVGGVLLGLFGVDLLVALVPGDLRRMIPGFERLTVNAAVLAFTAGLSLASALLFGLVPALRAAGGTAGRDALRSGANTSGRERHRLRRALVGAEVTLALLLLVGAGLTLRTFRHLGSLSPGFDVQGVALTSLALPGRSYPDAPAATRFYSRLVERIAAIPGVAAAGAANVVPLCGCNQTSGFSRIGAPPYPPGEGPEVDWRIITPGYFSALRIALVAGRDFRATDGPEAPPVAIVNETVSRRWFPDGGALGHRLHLGGDTTRSVEVIGIVSDIRHHGLAQQAPPEMYVSAAQLPSWEMTVVARAAGGEQMAAALLPALRAAVLEIDPNQPVYDQQTMSNLLALSMLQYRFSLRLLAALGLVALVLAGVGIYGVIAQLVAERTREIGIRIALGGDQRMVQRLVVRQGMLPAAIGVGAGLLLAPAVTMLVRRMLVGVSPNDPLTFGTVAVVLLGVALAACWLPARRAARVDPMVALRSE
jgi:putative ABC transport system permease protein